jgi:hypothetical protein
MTARTIAAPRSLLTRGLILAAGVANLLGCGGPPEPFSDGTPPPSESGEFDSGPADLESATFALTRGQFDVGVIKEVDVDCPSGSELIRLGFDNEDDDNNNSTYGWVGATQGRRNLSLYFCRVDGREFKRRRGTTPALNYAVLKLGEFCPVGSVSFTRYFDNEDDPFDGGKLGLGTPTCRTQVYWSDGNIYPNSYGGNCRNNLWMKFCMFVASESGTTSPFPALGFRYGVFASETSAGEKPYGYVYTDDEDDDNNNKIYGDDRDGYNHIGSEVFLDTGRNTRLHMVRVR